MQRCPSAERGVLVERKSVDGDAPFCVTARGHRELGFLIFFLRHCLRVISERQAVLIDMHYRDTAYSTVNS